MTEMHNEILKSSTPRWLRIFGTFSGIVIVLLFGFYTVQFIYNHPSDALILRALLLFGVIVLIVGSYAKTIFYTVSATDRGLETDNIIGANQLMLWEDIVGVQKPRFGLPANTIYVVSKSGDKVSLIKNHTLFRELIEYIGEHAPNLHT